LLNLMNSIYFFFNLFGPQVYEGIHEQQYAKYFRVKFMHNGNIVLDADLLKKAGIKNNKYYDAILRIASGNEPVLYRNLAGNEPLYLLDNTNDGTPIRRTLSNLRLYGFTLASGNDNFSGDQIPKYISPKRKTEVLINKYYSLLEQVKTAGHETGHADNYSNGELWGYENRYPELNDLVIGNEITAESGFNTWAEEAK